MERVWELSQDPDLHSRWDGRFSAIRHTGVRDDGAQLFCYERDLRFHKIRGRGESLGEKRAPDGSRTSALLFDTDDRLSPIKAGRGYWRYFPHAEGVRFITGYDYEPGLGAIGHVFDRIITRRFVWWLTAWSFDRLRLWAEAGIKPERVKWWKWWPGESRARARNCLSRLSEPRNTDVMGDAPASLGKLENHD